MQNSVDLVRPGCGVEGGVERGVMVQLDGNSPHLLANCRLFPGQLSIPFFPDTKAMPHMSIVVISDERRPSHH